MAANEVKPIRIGILTEIPSPYRVPLFNALADQDGIDVEVFFLREQQAERPHPLFSEEFRFGWRVLPGFVAVGGFRWLIINTQTIRAIRRAELDVLVLGGWNQPAFWLGLLAARRRIRTIAWVESTLRDLRPDSGIRRTAKRAFLRACDSCVVPGRAAAEFVTELGVRPERITVAPNAIDLTIFGERVANSWNRRDDLRARLGVTGFCILYAGRLSPEKGVDVLLHALRNLPPDANLVIAGIGPQEPELRRFATDALAGRVRFIGFVSRDDLVDWYAVADALVVPSRSETWGMTLNEGAAAGLPLVATEAAGGAWELVEDGVNGFRVPAGDAAALAGGLERLRSDDAFRASAGRRSSELGRAFTPEAWANAVAGVAQRLAG